MRITNEIFVNLNIDNYLKFLFFFMTLLYAKLITNRLSFNLFVINMFYVKRILGILDKQIKANPALPHAPTKNPPLN